MSISMLRKITLMLGACVMALLFSACSPSNPSVKGASETALLLTEALYKNDLDTVLDHFDFSNFQNVEQKMAMRKMIKGKMSELLKMRMSLTDRSGGVKSFNVLQASALGNDMYSVVVQVTFNDESSDNSKFNLKWDENKEIYFIVN